MPAQTYVAPPLSIGTWSINADSSGCNNDNNLAVTYAAEQLNIAGANVNVFRMLGVNEQGQLQDLTGSGNAISSATAAGFLASNAFVANSAGWQSNDVGPGVTANAFLGYNFGSKLSVMNTQRYDPPAPIRQEITTIRIQQGPLPQNRVLQARIERSDDGGLTWMRASVVNLPNTGNLETVALQQSGPSQLWRVVPLMFAGGATDPWIVMSLQMMNYTQTNLDNVEDMIFLENRDRDYADVSIQIKASYDLIDVETELTKFGIDLPQQYVFTVSYAAMVDAIGRPVVIGDILELPSELQYDQNLNAVRKWLEVTDCGWSQEGYTPGWLPILYRITAVPAIASQENMSLFKSDKGYTTLTDAQFMIDDSPLNLLPQESAEAILKAAEDEVPETGTDVSGLQSGMDMFGKRGSYDGQDLYAEDGLPPNDAPYTEASAFPPMPSDGVYHRLTYPNTNVPTKLYQWNAVKNRWIYLETDRRHQQTSFKPGITRLMGSPNQINITDKQ
jgi:hypothetical protein